MTFDLSEHIYDLWPEMLAYLCRIRESILSSELDGDQKSWVAGAFHRLRTAVRLPGLGQTVPGVQHQPTKKSCDDFENNFELFLTYSILNTMQEQISTKVESFDKMTFCRSKVI